MQGKKELSHVQLEPMLSPDWCGGVPWKIIDEVGDVHLVTDHDTGRQVFEYTRKSVQQGAEYTRQEKKAIEKEIPYHLISIEQRPQYHDVCCGRRDASTISLGAD